MPYLGIFGLKFKINVTHIWNQYPQIYLIAKCCEKTRTRTFGLEVQKTIVIFRISTLEFVYLQNFTKKAKMPKFSLHFTLLLHFKSTSLNLFCFRVWCKNRNPEIWDQKCLTLVFLGWKLKIIKLYLKSASSNLSTCKNFFKNENA